jgi:hypothetical protein
MNQALYAHMNNKRKMKKIKNKKKKRKAEFPGILSKMNSEIRPCSFFPFSCSEMLIAPGSRSFL